MSKNQWRHKWTSALFVIGMVGVGAVNALFPSKETISEVENRTLATLPEFTLSHLVEGDFFSQIESFYDDHFLYRDDLVLASRSLEAYKGVNGDDDVSLVSGNSNENYGSEDDSENGSEVDSETEDEDESLLAQETHESISTANDLNQRVRNLAGDDIETFTQLTPIETSVDDDQELERMEITEDENLSGGMEGKLLVVGDTVYELFGYSEKSCDYYASAINAFAEALGDDVNYYSIVAPNHIEFIPSEKYRSLSESQADAINYIYGDLDDEVTGVNAYTPIAEHSDEYVYYRTDHHWTDLGAYYAYTAFAKAIGDIPYDLSDFEKVDIPGFLGTLYDETRDQTVAANPDTVEVYEPFVDTDFTIYTSGGSTLNWDLINMNYANYSNKYLVFISGDNPLSIVKTDVHNGRKILVFKDSYGNAFVPYLTSHYEEIYIIDPRKYQDGAVTFAKENDIDDVLFLNSAIIVAGNRNFANNIYRITY